MKLPTFASGFARSVMVLALLAGTCASAFARGGSGTLSISYSPSNKIIEGNMPFSTTYNLHVVLSGTVTGNAVNVGFAVSPSSVPVGTAADAASYVTFSPSTVSVTPGTTQSFDVAVTVNFPVLALPSAITSATFAYQIATNGWANASGQTNAGLSISDPGFSINATASLVPPPVGSPPTVKILTPANGTVLNYPANAVPSTIPFQFSAYTDLTSPINAYDADLGGVNVTLTPTVDPATGTLTATGNLTIAGPGQYTVTARASNGNGQTSAASVFTISVSAAKPTVTFTQPAPNTAFPLRWGSTGVNVQVSFTANTTNPGGIQTLSATDDAAAATFSPAGLGTATATGTYNRLWQTVTSATGTDTHTALVTTTDQYGTATGQLTYTVYWVKPAPTVAIGTPVTGDVITGALNALTADVPFTYTAGSTNQFNVDAVTVTLDGNPITLPAPLGLGTPSATFNGIIPAVTSGTHTVVVTATSAGISSPSASATFTVKLLSSRPPDPTVTIDSPAANAPFTRYLNGPALSIPLTFTGTSNATNGTITMLHATLDGAPLAVSATYGTKVVTGTSTLTVMSAGQHTIAVDADDSTGGHASTSSNIFVTVLDGYTVSGTTFFDLNSDGQFNGPEFGLGSVVLTLKSTAGQSFGSATSAADGTYSFSKIPPGTYVVTAAAPYPGLTATNGLTANVTVGTANVSGVNIGFMLDFCALQHMSANGYSLGFWKNNVGKALKGSCSGTQIPASTIAAYTTAIGSLALPVYDGISSADAVAIMSSRSSQPTALLSKQLIAAEYNYENGAYLNGNSGLTGLFIWWGEYVLSNPTRFSSGYILWAKDWFDAYDNSHGGTVSGPTPTGGNCTGSGSSDSGSCGSDDDSSDDNHQSSGDCSDDSGDNGHEGSCGGNDQHDSRGGGSHSDSHGGDNHNSNGGSDNNGGSDSHHDDGGDPRHS